MELGSAIAKLRNAKGLTQREFAQEIGVSNGAVAMWETNKRQPDLEMLQRICDYFDVPLTRILGHGDRINATASKKSGFFFFNEWALCHSRILKELERLSISEAKFEDDTEIHLDAKTEVNISGLIKTANYLNVSTDYLLGLTDDEYVSSEDISLAQSLTDRERDVLAAFRRLDDDNKDIIVGEIKKCLKEQRHSSVAADEPSQKTGTTNMGN